MTRIVPLAVVFLALAATASAEESLLLPNGEDDRFVADCLAQAERNKTIRAVCLGGVAERCMKKAGFDTTGIDTGCHERESAYWEGKLNERYAFLLARLGDRQATALRDAQLAWTAMRNETCAFEASLWAGGTGEVAASVACYARETGLRALFLQGIDEFLDER